MCWGTFSSSSSSVFLLLFFFFLFFRFVLLLSEIDSVVIQLHSATFDYEMAFTETKQCTDRENKPKSQARKETSNPTVTNKSPPHNSHCMYPIKTPTASRWRCKCLCHCHQRSGTSQSESHHQWLAGARASKSVSGAAAQSRLRGAQLCCTPSRPQCTA